MSDDTTTINPETAEAPQRLRPGDVLEISGRLYRVRKLTSKGDAVIRRVRRDELPRIRMREEPA